MPRKRQAEIDNHAATEAALAETRARDGLLVIHAYCPHPGCPVREFDIRVKDYDRELLRLVHDRDLRCAVCGRPVKCHEVLTFADEQIRDDRRARASVNLQIFERDHQPTPGGLLLVPASVMCDDTLPGGEHEHKADTHKEITHDD